MLRIGGIALLVYLVFFAVLLWTDLSASPGIPIYTHPIAQINPSIKPIISSVGQAALTASYFWLGAMLGGIGFAFGHRLIKSLVTHLSPENKV